jgi:hypothetical protein
MGEPHAGERRVDGFSDIEPDGHINKASITARPVFEAFDFHVLVAQTVKVRGESMTNYPMEKRLESSAATLNPT